MRAGFIIQISRHCLGDKFEAALIAFINLFDLLWFHLPNLIYVKVS